MMGSTKIKKRGRGRPRNRDTGSRPATTQLSPAARAAVEDLARLEKKSVALMLTDLVEQALRERGRLKA